MDKKIGIVCFLGVLLCCCNGTGLDKDKLSFNILPASATGLDFNNAIVENDSINLLDYYYVYNGAGLGVGDVNNDNLPDLFFGGNMVSSKLYLNRGEFQFEDITDRSNLNANVWAMGVSMVDINADGWLDIYVNVAGQKKGDMENLLFINQGLDADGIPKFVEKAGDYGINDKTFSVHSSFFDYDKDGDLDLFVLTNRIDEVNKVAIIKKDFPATDGRTIDRFYENIGFVDSLGHAYFEERSFDSGIIHEGYGLGLSVNDINEDGWPDVYVANDFMPNDRLYINQRDGTFKDMSEHFLKHQSYNGMGVDIADINNDLLPDILVLDMLPDNNDRRKSMLSGMHPKRFKFLDQAGYIPQYVRNTLQLNRGIDRNGQQYFSDISQLSGVNATDWSWAPLLADFDNDGDKDIFISNGFVKDMTDLDFINYDANNSYFGTKAEKKVRLKSLYEILPEVKIPNFLYQNDGNLSYRDVSEDSGVGVPSFSNGAIYSDLDNDGDLDIVTNDINSEALVYENTSTPVNNYLKIRFKDPKGKANAIGAKIYIKHGPKEQFLYNSPTKGYLSSINHELHFGIGKDTILDEVRIVWPDGTMQSQKNVMPNQTLGIDYKPVKNIVTDQAGEQSYFYAQAIDSIINYTHEENIHSDFDTEPLLLRMYSKGGPVISVGQIDGEKGMDLFIGGSAGHDQVIFVQDAEGKFKIKQSGFMENEAIYEDMGSMLFDCDNDGDNDLYVVSGGSEFEKNTANYQDRLYLNDGKGNFELSNKLPKMNSSGSCVVGNDYDKDGDIDLFVGGRYSPGEYPIAPESYLLENTGTKFVDQTQHIEGLSRIGMVTDALWSDYDNDGWTDLILVGEWMPLTIFKNNNGRLEKLEHNNLSETTGWWNTVESGDFDNDGDTDYVVGNLGHNQDYKATKERPFLLYADDFDDNGKVDPIFACYMKSTAHGEVDLFPYHGLDDLTGQIVAYKKIFKTYQKYSETPFNKVLTDNLTKNALKLEAKIFASSIFINNGDAGFTVRELPVEAQMAPINAMVIQDIDQDGNLDIIAAGNNNASENSYGLHDASLGICLLGDGQNNFTAVAPTKSGIYLQGSVNSMEMIRTNSERTALIAGVNSDKLMLLVKRDD